MTFKTNFLLIAVLIILVNGCVQDKSKKLDKSRMRGDDIRLFEDGKAWKLALAVNDGDTSEIKYLIKEKNLPVDFREERFGKTLLMWCVRTNHYNSAKALLESGANPNLPDTYDGTTAFMDACDCLTLNDTSTAMMKLLLSFGGDPNSIEVGIRRKGNSTRKTPLNLAATCCYEKTKILVETGADINFVNEFGESALRSASIGFNNSVLTMRYLLIEKGADFKKVYSTTINGDTLTIVNWLRNWTYPLDSKEYKVKMEIVDFLKKRGLDYWETKVPNHYYENYSAEYLEKY